MARTRTGEMKGILLVMLQAVLSAFGVGALNLLSLGVAGCAGGCDYALHAVAVNGFTVVAVLLLLVSAGGVWMFRRSPRLVWMIPLAATGTVAVAIVIAIALTRMALSL